jgi:hypothetical protein
MDGSRPRKLTLVDAMIFIAATGAGIAVIRTYAPSYYAWSYNPTPPPTWVEWAAFVLPSWADYLAPIPAAWTIGTLIQRLFPTRPPLRIVCLQAGTAAVLAATVAVSVNSVYLILHVWTMRSAYHEMAFVYTTHSAGIAVGGVWLVLALGGTWRAEPTWIDRWGRALGIYWLLMIPLQFLSLFVRH